MENIKETKVVGDDKTTTAVKATLTFSDGTTKDYDEFVGAFSNDKEDSIASAFVNVNALELADFMASLNGNAKALLMKSILANDNMKELVKEIID